VAETSDGCACDPHFDEMLRDLERVLAALRQLEPLVAAPPMAGPKPATRH
jgi:hypothetical protein